MKKATKRAANTKPTVKNSKKKQYFLIGSIVVALLIGASITYALLQAQQNSSQPAPQEPQAEIPTDQTPVEEPQAPSGQPYANEHLGFSLRYPDGWLELECDGQPNAVYFASDERGIGNSTPTGGALCGGGSDFPAQVAIRTIDPQNAQEIIDEATEDVIVDGKTLHKYIRVSGSFGLYPEGFETTGYLVENEGTYIEFSYHKWPEGNEHYDTTEESKQNFINMIENTLTFSS